MTKTTILTLFAVLALAGCASLQPSKDLLDARAAYDKASKGPAATENPAELSTAKKFLDQAEDALAQGDEPIATDKAYVALRKAETADAIGRASQAAKDRDAARAELGSAKDAALGSAQERLKAAQSDLGKSQEQLAAERQAREAAEAKLKDSLDRLNQFAKVREEERGTVITLSGSVLFASNKADLLPSSQTQLTAVADALKSSERPILVEGYTDSRGSVEHNMDLSRRRAQSVVDFLTLRGVPATRLRGVGRGLDRPVADNGTAEGRANNRRVEIILERAAADSSGAGTSSDTTAPDAGR